MQLGEKIKKARLSLGYTQKDLARLTGVDNATISNIEIGRKPSNHLLAKIDSILFQKLSPFQSSPKSNVMTKEEWRKVCTKNQFNKRDYIF